MTFYYAQRGNEKTVVLEYRADRFNFPYNLDLIYFNNTSPWVYQKITLLISFGVKYT